MGSILDEVVLNKENFEAAIGVGMTSKQIAAMFNTTVEGSGGLDEWCRANYNGLSFSRVYDTIQQAVYLKFMGTVKSLGLRGNPSALNIINNAITHTSAEQIVTIHFEDSLPKETEKDNLDDGE